MVALSHAEARHAIQLASDQRLSGDAHAALQQHLLECAACRAYASELSDLQSALKRSLHARWDQHRAPSQARRLPKPQSAAVSWPGGTFRWVSPFIGLTTVFVVLLTLTNLRPVQYTPMVVVTPTTQSARLIIQQPPAVRYQAIPDRGLETDLEISSTTVEVDRRLGVSSSTETEPSPGINTGRVPIWN